MKPVDQTVFGDDGDCFSACVASILELPLADVPYFMGDPVDDWWPRVLAWLDGRGLTARYYLAESLECGPPPGYSIIGGETFRLPEGSGKLHAAVALDGVLVHDPSPLYGRRGVRSVQDYIVILGRDQQWP